MTVPIDNVAPIKTINSDNDNSVANILRVVGDINGAVANAVTLNDS